MKNKSNILGWFGGFAFAILIILGIGFSLFVVIRNWQFGAQQINIGKPDPEFLLRNKIRTVCIDGFEYMYSESNTDHANRSNLVPRWDYTGKPHKCEQ